MRVEVLYSDSSGNYRVRADIRENNRTVHILDIIDNDYGSEADWDDFTDDEKGEIQNLLMEEYDTLAAEPAEPEPDEGYDEDEDSGDPPYDY